MYASKNTVFQQKKTLNCRGQILRIDRPLVMGVINLTPDSFYAQSKYSEEKALLKRVEEMIEEGADIIDLGAVSSRPGAEVADEQTEMERLIPALTAIVTHFPGTIISVDTFHSGVVKEACDRGAHIINDISAGQLDDEMLSTVAGTNMPYVLMHMQGLPENMQDNPAYENVVTEVLDFLREKERECRNAGIRDVIIDPGFGFGKNLEHNYQLLQNLHVLQMLDRPVLVGISRKRMLCRLLEIGPEAALNASTVVHTLALMQGADILRVHDVKEAREAIKITQYSMSLH